MHFNNCIRRAGRWPLLILLCSLFGGVSQGFPLAPTDFAGYSEPSSPPLESSKKAKGLGLSDVLTAEVRIVKGYGLVKAGLAEDTGEFYRASGRKIALYRSVQKVAMRKSASVSLNARLKAGSLPALNLENDVPSRDMSILQAQTPMTHEELQAVLGTPGTDPVYINEETGSEAVVSDRFIVRLAKDVEPESLEAFHRDHGVIVLSPLQDSDREYVCQKPGAAGPEILVLCETYGQNPSVEWASPDFVFQLQLCYTPSDPFYANQWFLNNVGQTGATPDADVDAPEAWDQPGLSRGGSPNIVIAIIDTGVDIDHEDLNGNIYRNLSEVNGTPGVDDDGNGYIDDINGWDFSNNDNNPRPTTQGHGTCCAGVAAAKEGNGLARFNEDVEVCCLQMLYK
jgi:hypothetical protein